MKKRRVTRYIADCGKGFWNKFTCLEHEINCKCWTNPAFRTCKTCAFSYKDYDSNGMEHDPQSLETWEVLGCSNPKFNYDEDFDQAHENAPTVCVNCPKWKYKKGDYKGPFRTWKI